MINLLSSFALDLKQSLGTRTQALRTNYFTLSQPTSIFATGRIEKKLAIVIWMTD